MVKHLITDQTTKMREEKKKLEEKLQETQVQVATLESELNKTSVLFQQVKGIYYIVLIVLFVQKPGKRCFLQLEKTTKTYVSHIG